MFIILDESQWNHWTGQDMGTSPEERLTCDLKPHAIPLKILPSAHVMIAPDLGEALPMYLMRSIAMASCKSA